MSDTRYGLSRLTINLMAAASTVTEAAADAYFEPGDRTDHNVDVTGERLRRAALRYAAERLEKAGAFPRASALLMALSESDEP